MKVTKYLSDCIRRIFKGETDVITDAEAAGVELVEAKVESPCLYVRIDENDADGHASPSLMSLYFITPIDGRFQVAAIAERVPHNLGDVFTGDQESFHKASIWWEMVFIREDDSHIEAPLADEFSTMKVSDSDNRNLEEFIMLLKDCVGAWKAMVNNLTGVESVILCSSQPFCVSLPLLYAIQEVFCLPVSIRAACDNLADDVRKSFVLSDELVNANISEGTEVQLGDVISCDEALTVTLPVSKQFEQIKLLGIISGDRLYDEIPVADYKVGGSLGFKRACLRAFTDAYGGVYLSISGGNTLRIGNKDNQIQILSTSSDRNHTA